jgi:hypothetical protein
MLPLTVKISGKLQDGTVNMLEHGTCSLFDHDQITQTLVDDTNSSCQNPW